MKEKLKNIMKEDKETKKRLGVIVISLILMIGLVIGLTYAAFTYTSSGTQENIVSTTAVTMKYTEKTNGITLENAMPTSDEVGKTLALDSNYAFYFTVSITTGSNTPIGYEVTAEKLTAKELFEKNLTDEDKEEDVELVKDDEVRLYLERSENNPDNYQSIMEPTIYTPLTTATPLGAQVGEMMLDFGTVSETKTYHYILRMWVGENYNVDDIERYYGVRVNVYGTDSRSYSNTLTLSKNSLELEIDESEQLTPTVTPNNVTNADITWASSDSTIATVDTLGNVTGVKAGTAVITATTSKGRKATCNVIVNGKSPKSIAIKENDATLENITLITENSKIVNASVTPNDYDDSTYSVTWTTSDSDVVDIEEVTEGTTGTSSNDETIIASKMASKNITAKKVKLKAGSTPGNATITATIKNKEGQDVSTSFTVTVEYPNANSVTLDTTKATMDIGDSTTLTVTINPTNVKNDEIVWTSNNSSVIDVSSCSGKSCTVEGLSDGEVSITATIKDTDISDTSIITVQKPEITKIEMSSDISIKKGKKTTFTLNITPSEVRNQSVITWTSSNTNIATIPESCNGSLSCEVEGLAEGTTTIEASIPNTTIKDSATLTVEGITTEVTGNMATAIKSLASEMTDTMIADDGTTDHNTRYTGSDPANWVEFNGEKWRIVGVFNNIKSSESDSTGETRVKIMKATAIGSDEETGGYKLTWDSGKENSGYGTNDWTATVTPYGGDLMKLLNPGYDTNIGYSNVAETTTGTINNSLYWNRTSGTCYMNQTSNSEANKNSSCTFANDGLTDVAKAYIAKTNWRLGAHNDQYIVLENNSFLSTTLYNAERGSTHAGGDSNAPLYWDGYVGLIYPSDYAYAGYACTKAYQFYDSSGNDVRQCNTKNWMFTGYPQHFLSPRSTKVSDTWFTDSNGRVALMYASYGLTVRPSVYLKSSVTITSGDGSEDNPYKLTIGTEKATTYITNKAKEEGSGTIATETTVTESTTLMKDSTTDNNIRYISANAKNYVNFNNELWRIVGVFNNIKSINSDNTGETRIKLMKATPIGDRQVTGGYSLSWDTGTENSGFGTNDWTGTLSSGTSGGDLMKLLNPGYTSNSVNNSLYWNRTSGTCYNGYSNATTTCSFESDGITLDAKKLFNQANWKLGAHATTNVVLGESTGSGTFLNTTLYNAERGSIHAGGNSSVPLYWDGYIGLVYPSDYAYAGFMCNRDYVLQSNGNDISQCITKNWMYKGFSSLESFLSPRSDVSSQVWNITWSGAFYWDPVGYAMKVRPSVYLKSNVRIISDGADGSKSNPYNLILGS